MRALMWFRSDLRVNDQMALFNASRHCRDGVMGVFFIPKKTWAAHHMAPCKVDLILRQLSDLKNELETINIPLKVIELDTYDECVDELLSLCTEHEIGAVYFNREYEVNELNRDLKAEGLLSKQGIKVQAFDDLLIAPPGKILTPKAQPYTVFTPFKKAWLGWMPRHGNIQPLNKPELQVERFTESSDIPTQVKGFESPIDAALWPAGEAFAYQRLESFVANHLGQYGELRDFPMKEATSRLSPYLNIGAISVRQCLNLAISAQHVKSNQNVEDWINELIWREFYKHISFHFPRVCKGHAYHENYDNMKWDHRQDWIDAWKKGETGFPLVDAAMKQLVQTGWMHNRLRMVVAMFFTKIMFQDWHIGEQFFMEHLIDGDFSANNGGWQWCASTGTDAAPYFRLFNPIRQSENFDADGEFIKQYIPALSGFSAADIHEPFISQPELAQAAGYVQPILDYATQRKITLAAFKAFTETA